MNREIQQLRTWASDSGNGFLEKSRQEGAEQSELTGA